MMLSIAIYADTPLGDQIPDATVVNSVFNLMAAFLQAMAKLECGNKERLLR
jgi:hypothetical protein